MSSDPRSSRGVEVSIQEAIERGDFDNLRGKGRPLNLDEYFEAPEDRRLGYSLLKAGGFRPPEVELLGEIAALEAEIGEATDECERLGLRRLIQRKRLHYSLIHEEPRRRSRKL
jgi:hypothetical protein